MTAILGFADGINVWLGGDSAGIDGSWDKFAIMDHKIFRKYKMLIGVAGAFRIKQLIHAAFEPPYHDFTLSPFVYLITLFIPALQKFLKEAELSLTDEDHGTVLLIGYAGSLYYLTPDFSCSEIMGGLYAIGSGSDLALGAFKVYQDNYPVEFSMIAALEIAGQYNLTVAAPYYVEKI